MKERPILFSGPMVRAILAGTKTQTRRPVRVQPDRIVGDMLGQPQWYIDGDPGAVIRCPYGVAGFRDRPGDRLWVKESFSPAYYSGGAPAYMANWTGESADLVPRPKFKAGRFMPRALSRIDLEITAVRVERLQDITEEDARAEGVPAAAARAVPPGEDVTRKPCVNCGRRRAEHEGAARSCRGGPGGATFFAGTYRGGFAWLWNEINGKRAPWESNPWVWVVGFRKVSR